MRAVVIAILTAALPLAAPDARADSNEGGYGERIVAVDLASDAVLIAGLYAEGDWVIYAGIAGHALGGPIVHLFHERPGRAAISLGARVGLPALGGLIGQAACSRDSGLFACVGYVATGVIVGVLAAQVVDPLLIVPDAPPEPAMLSFRF